MCMHICVCTCMCVLVGQVVSVWESRGVYDNFMQGGRSGKRIYTNMYMSAKPKI